MEVIAVGNKCSICSRDDCQQITEDILGGVTYRKIQEKYGCSIGAIHRHKQHSVIQPVPVLSEIDVTNQMQVMYRIDELNRRADQIYKASLKQDDRLNALRALRELREILELYSKLTGELSTQAIHQHLHITASPEWETLRHKILEALAPYADARMAVIRAIGEEISDA